MDVEGQGHFTRTGADGNWALFGVQPGLVVLRYAGGASAEGRAYPTVRRRFAVEAERDNVESTVMLTPVDAESAEQVDTSVPLHLTFGGRHGGLELDIPAGGLTFEGGTARGLVTATELPLHALPVPTDGPLRPAAVWQLQPAGTSLVEPVELRLPNRLQGQPGSRALLFTYDPEEHLLRMAGLATVSADGTQLVSDGPLAAGSLEYFGYLPLPEEASAALAGAAFPPGALSAPLPRPPWEGPIRPLNPGFGMDPASTLFFWEYFNNIIHPFLVMGTIRGPREQAVALDLQSPPLGSEQRVMLDSQGQYRMPLSVQARSLIPPPTTSGPEPLVLTVEGTGPGGQRLGPPSGGSWRQESPEGRQAELSTEVELSLGSSALSASGTTRSGRNVLRLNAELALEDGGVSDGGSIPGVLRVQRMDGGSSGVEDTEGLVRFGGLPVTVRASWFEGATVSGPTGRYAGSTLIAWSLWLPTPTAQACVPLPIGYQIHSWVTEDGRVHTRKTPSIREECSSWWDIYGLDFPPVVDVLIDVRWLHGSVTLVDREGQPLPPACEPAVVREGNEIAGLSQDDVRSTEVHFFREDDPSTPIVSYTVADPFPCEGSPAGPHGRYAQVRLGPSTFSGSAGSPRSRHRLVPGDRLVVFAINHATGHAGMKVVTVPSVNRSSRAEDGSCPADEAAGGPLPVQDGERTVLLSRCTLQDLGIQTDLELYPPELDVRVDRRARAEGVSQGAMEPSLIRHGGAGTTRDDFVRVATHWRVRRQPALSWDAGVLEPVDSSCDGGIQQDGGFCAPQPLFDEGERGRLLERYCAELPEPRTAEQQTLCLRDDRELTEVPAGVPPLAGRVVRITGSAVEQPAVASFPIPPGRSTSTVQTSLRRVDQDGSEVVLNNLPRANYYVQVVGHPVLPRDRNKDGTIDSAEENAPPPDFTDGEGAPGLPERAMAVKNVYRSLEPEGKMERYDRAREHEFRVLEMGSAQVTARTDRGQERPLPRPGEPPSSAAASPEDVAYQFLLHLLEPEDDGRAGTLSGQYALRLGTDSFGIECPIELDESAGTLRGTCEGEYLPEVLSAGDVLYLELYLRGNAENVLYRFNFNGLSMREDYLGAGSRFTASRAVEQQDGKPVEDRPISQPNEAHFFIAPHELSVGRIRLCTDEECSGEGAVIKDARLVWTGAGKYSVSEQEQGSATAKLIQDDKAGAGNARHFRLGLPASLTQMPGADDTAGAAEIFLIKDIESPPRGRQVERLGRPKGRFQGLHAQAPGQQAVAGINVADLHLGFTHTDFAVPQLAEVVSFSRTYVNQNDLPSPLGVGWRHGLDGFVLEEQLGRYVVNLGSQAWGFLRCATVDQGAQTASQCVTDKTHGMELEVDGEGVKLTTEQGRVYRFDRPAVKRDKEGRRKWLLTKFHDGHGRGEEEGWTHLTYAEGSNRITKAQRTPGELSLEFKYCEDFTREDCEGLPPDAPGLLKFLARSEGFKLLKGVLLKSGPRELHVVRFEHDRWGNLLEAERTTDPPAQKWTYTYAALPEDVAPDKAWRAVNELSEARFEVNGQAQWTSTYERGGAECYAHLAPFECVSSVNQTGFMGNPLRVQGGPDNRELSLPTGTSARLGLNEYGNVTSSLVAGQPARQLSWASSQRGGEVHLEKSVSPGGRTLLYGADARMRMDEVKVEGGSDVVGLGSGELVSVSSRDALGLPTAGKMATANGLASWSMPRSPAGDVQGLTVGTTTLFSRHSDEDGRIVSETDALGNTTVYSFGTLGLPVTARVSAGSATGGLASYTLTMEYDDYGRLTRRSNGATGEEESWSYDGQGNVLQHTRAGTPSEQWTYEYSYGDHQLTVRESLAGVGYSRTAVFEQGLLKSELLSYGTGSATRLYEYERGRLKQKTDERGFAWEYAYDSTGRLEKVTSNGDTVEEYDRDADGNVVSITDREGRIVALANDSLGRPVSWTYSEDGYQEQVRRDAQGAIVWQKTVSPGASTPHVFDQEVDSFGRVLARRSAGGGSGVEIVSTYDTAGRVRTREDTGTGLSESFEYGDALGRVTRHERTVQSKAGPLSWIETRQYQDGGGRTEIQIHREIGTGSGARVENQTLVMDALGRVLRVEQAGAGAFEYTYDARGNVLTRRHSILGTTSYTYDGLGHLLSVTEPGGVTTTYTVDAGGLVLSQQGPHEQEQWTFSYDRFGRPKTRVLAQAGSTPGASWSFEYPGGGVVIEKDPLDVETTRRFNSRDLLLEEVRGDRSKEYAYDGTLPRLQRVTHQGGSVLELTRSFDDLGRPLLEVEHWEQGGRSYTYSTSTAWSGLSATRHEQWQATGADTQTRTAAIAVDGLGNLVEKVQGGLTDAWTYDAAGVLAREALAGQPQRHFFYEQNRLDRVEYGSETTLYAYDAAGRLERETNPSGRARTRTYNAQGLLERESFGAGETLASSYTYDRGGFLQTMTRGGMQWKFTHGPRGELRSVELPGSLGTFTYQYDALLQLREMTPPAGEGAVAQTFRYDDFGRQRLRTRGTSAWTTLWQGGLSTTSDLNGDVVERLHDGRGRIVSENFQPGSRSQPFNHLTAVAYAYDGLDQLLSALESRGSETVSNVYAYDERSRLRSIRRGSDVVSYTYTASGQKQTVTSPSGTVRYEYDAQDRVELIESSQGPSVTVGWAPGGLLSEVSGNGVVEQYAYWGHGLIRSITAAWTGATAGSLRYEYDYDARGNRLEERYTGPGGTVPEVTQYGYDAADRLTGVRYPSGESELYTLGGDGSRLEEKRVQGFQGSLGPQGLTSASSLTKHWQYSYDTAGGLERIDDVLTGGVEAQVTTDPGGRVAAEVRGGTTRQYGWDAGGRLTSIRRITAEETVEASYTYGFDGLRRERTVGGVGTRYVWGGNEELLEEGSAAGARWVYARAGFGAVAAGGERLLRDALGSVVGRVGATTQLSRYGAWGALRQGEAPDGLGPTLAYAGQHFDSDVGLSYAQQRWYSPDIGRFLSEDPVGAMGYLSTPTELNSWLYARGNPMAYLDPSGRWSTYEFGYGVGEFAGKAWRGTANTFLWAARPLNAALGVSSGRYDENGNYRLESTGSFTEEWLKQGQQIGAVARHVASNPWATVKGVFVETGQAIGTGVAACVVAATTDGSIGDEASKDCGATLPEAIAGIYGAVTGAGTAARVVGNVARHAGDLSAAVSTAVSASDDLARLRQNRESLIAGDKTATPDPFLDLFEERSASPIERSGPTSSRRVEASSEVPASLMMKRLKGETIGDFGERVAAAALQERGFNVVGSIHNGRKNGIDIFAFDQKGNPYTFEIKATRGSRFITPRGDQKYGWGFSMDRLGKAALRGRYWGRVDPATQQQAHDILMHMMHGYGPGAQLNTRAMTVFLSRSGQSVNSITIRDW
ncbi:RHS repeat-associated core domain-containing protein [Hyalangium sp.]|uniref:RHS repeat-associated core domain-containing protein n=1 Tax=Hyalangium sp. TaxID=2028555 RepID=UPI002D49A28E|nr:RHS repeat-associated core domain-containing protein [Hyalangium sp.]HYH99709.1 RHS repeat-associated core domain-containing protein [Hyalangium sp.]